MPRPAAAAVGLLLAVLPLLGLPGPAAALRRSAQDWGTWRPQRRPVVGPKASRSSARKERRLAQAAAPEECSESEMYETVGDACYDLAGQTVASKCCRLYDACRQEVSALGHTCAVRVQQYLEGCDLLPTDTSTDGSEHGELRIVDTTRLCGERCQAHPALFLNSTLEKLADLEARCSPHLDRIRMVVNTVQHFDATWSACPPEEHIEVHKPRWGPVKITIHWVPPVLDLKNAFEVLWTALPVTYSEEFRIQGTVGAIQEELLLRPDLHVSCPESHAGRPVNLVVGKIQKQVAQVYQRALMGGFANMAGIGTLAVSAPLIFDVGGEGLGLASSLAANPTLFTLDSLVDYMMDNVHRGDKRYLKKLWRWMSGTRTDAFLTLADPTRKGHVGAKVKFQCSEMPMDGKLKTVATWVDGGNSHTVVTAKHLAFLITAFA